MSEVEKMYMRCKIKKKQNCSHTDTCYNGSLDECEGCNSYQYPPFTAEKQLSLIKWLARFDLRIEYTTAKYFIESHYHGYSEYIECFEEALASLINSLWQDLTEQEKTEIAEILRG